MKTRSLLIIAAIMLAGCKNKSDNADALVILKQQKLLYQLKQTDVSCNLMLQEGIQIEKGTIIALIDTTIFHLQKAEIDAGMKSVIPRINSINAQNDILKSAD